MKTAFQWNVHFKNIWLIAYSKLFHTASFYFIPLLLGPSPQLPPSSLPDWQTPYRHIILVCSILSCFHKSMGSFTQKASDRIECTIFFWGGVILVKAFIPISFQRWRKVGKEKRNTNNLDFIMAELHHIGQQPYRAVNFLLFPQRKFFHTCVCGRKERILSNVHTRWFPTAQKLQE